METLAIEKGGIPPLFLRFKFRMQIIPQIILDFFLIFIAPCMRCTRYSATSKNLFFLG